MHPMYRGESETGTRTKPAKDKVMDNGVVKTVGKAKAKPTYLEHGSQALEAKKKGTKATRKKIAWHPFNQSEQQLLAEAAVDISEILLGDGIHKINSINDRVRLAIRRAEAIQEVVAHGDYDGLLPDSPANKLPKITPRAFLRWLDDEFKDVIDAVFFVDSEKEFANILRTFAQEIAGSFFGDRVRVTVEVESTPRERKQPVISDQASKVAPVVQQAVSVS
jgi:hypothetical protein